jgi:hypothetical protein
MKIFSRWVAVAGLAMVVLSGCAPSASTNTIETPLKAGDSWLLQTENTPGQPDLTLRLETSNVSQRNSVLVDANFRGGVQSEPNPISYAALTYYDDRKDALILINFTLGKEKLELGCRFFNIKSGDVLLSGFSYIGKDAALNLLNPNPVTNGSCKMSKNK